MLACERMHLCEDIRDDSGSGGGGDGIESVFAGKVFVVWELLHDVEVDSGEPMEEKKERIKINVRKTEKERWKD